MSDEGMRLLHNSIVTVCVTILAIMFNPIMENKLRGVCDKAPFSFRKVGEIK